MKALPLERILLILLSAHALVKRQFLQEIDFLFHDNIKFSKLRKIFIFT